MKNYDIRCAAAVMWAIATPVIID